MAARADQDGVHPRLVLNDKKPPPTRLGREGASAYFLRNSNRITLLTCGMTIIGPPAWGEVTTVNPLEAWRAV
ncbi:hypothetical protein GA0074694_1849 [Micromonospora inyonensis]|uniref:Uncharacterized protein n=1 Tax=Micromonospora inyonensis TaxID=47866 RepID=A0A1C6RIK8_9ACTN|nr:hypothetical protein GA0074694_1849 [Micromonospora inyonensis]